MCNFGPNGEPKLSRAYTLNLVGDWGGANFHRICSWLTQEFCDRAGPGSRTSIWSLRDGGLDGLTQLRDGAVDLAICTPAALLDRCQKGSVPFTDGMQNLRALGKLPQDDRMVLGIDAKYGIYDFETLRRKKPALRLAASTNDGTNLIGYVADQYLRAHGIPEDAIESWGGIVLRRHRPDQCIALVESGEADAVLQEAIMTPWWRQLIETNKLVPLAAESQALQSLKNSLGLDTNPLPHGYWANLPHDLPALDFSDFVVLVRDDMPKDVAFLLTWCLVETRHLLEGQYKHIAPHKSPLTYPIEPGKVSQTPLPLHEGAKEYFDQRSTGKFKNSDGSTMSPF